MSPPLSFIGPLACLVGAGTLCLPGMPLGTGGGDVVGRGGDGEVGSAGGSAGGSLAGVSGVMEKSVRA